MLTAQESCSPQSMRSISSSLKILRVLRAKTCKLSKRVSTCPLQKRRWNTFDLVNIQQKTDLVNCRLESLDLFRNPTLQGRVNYQIYILLQIVECHHLVWASRNKLIFRISRESKVKAQIFQSHIFIWQICAGIGCLLWRFLQELLPFN